MVLTKREKILLMVLGCLLLFALELSLFISPSATAYLESDVELQELESELTKVEATLQYPELEQRLRAEKERAQENYQYFYSVLNSYTIDGIVNNLLQQEQLKIINLEITPYEDAYYDFAPLGSDVEGGEEEVMEPDHVLVKSVVSMNIQGEYNNILHFIDELNKTSTCLRVSNMSIAKNDLGIEEETGISAYLTIFIYGIDVEPNL